MPNPKVLIFEDTADWYARHLAARCPDFDFEAASNEDEAIDKAPGTEILIGLPSNIPPRLIAACDRLKWIQSLSAGVDSLVGMKEIGTNVTVTSCSGIHGPQMSELTLLLMMSLARQFPKMLANQRRGEWQRWEQPVLLDRTVCIVGLGSIAERLASVCLAFGMRVTGVSDSRTSMQNVDTIHPRSALKEAVGEADFVVVLVPLSPETTNMIDADVLSAMKSEAFIINIARGGVIKEADLIAALDAGTIAGAGLDVFGTEPLPSDSPFWERANVIVTPHIGGVSDRYHKDAMPLVAKNLQAYAAGGSDALFNVVDIKQS